MRFASTATATCSLSRCRITWFAASTPRSGKISTVAGTGAPGFAGDGGPAIKAQFRQPHSIAFDDRGQLYVADIGNHRIRQIDLAAGTIRTIAGNGQRELPVDGQKSEGHAMAGPRALAVTGRTLWVALREGHSVWRIDLDTLVTRHVSGTGKSGYSGDGGPATAATFNGPKGLVATSDGVLYVVDTENQVIRRIDTAHDRVETIAGSGPTRGDSPARSPRPCPPSSTARTASAFRPPASCSSAIRTTTECACCDRESNSVAGICDPGALSTAPNRSSTSPNRQRGNRPMRYVHLQGSLACASG